MTDLAALEQLLRVSFKDKELLQRALLHTSYVNEHPEQEQESNERLEFLGDAVLECVVTDDLFRQHPSLSEGDLTVLRSSLVNGEALSRVARALRLGEYLSLGAGEERSGGRERESNLAAAFEAFIGALFLDQGYARCRRVVWRLLGKEMQSLARQGIPRDAKSLLQQTLQASGEPSPLYHTAQVEGPEHDRHFTVEVHVGDRVLGVGEGRRKALAEQEAARQALRGLEESE